MRSGLPLSLNHGAIPLAGYYPPSPTQLKPTPYAKR